MARIKKTKPKSVIVNELAKPTIHDDLPPCSLRSINPDDSISCSEVSRMTNLPPALCIVGADACRVCMTRNKKENDVTASMSLRASREHQSPDEVAKLLAELRPLITHTPAAPVVRLTPDDLPCVYRGDVLKTITCEICGDKGRLMPVYMCDDPADKLNRSTCTISRWSNNSRLEPSKSCAGCVNRKPPESLVQIEIKPSTKAVNDVELRGETITINPQEKPAEKPHCKLTIGMACYDDESGVFMTVEALRLYHADILKASNAEILIVDSNPGQKIRDEKGKVVRIEGSKHGAEVRELCENWGGGILRYIPAEFAKGTSAPRDLVFREAKGEIVLCIDCHVMLSRGAIETLLDYFTANPDSIDLIQGPMLHHGCEPYATHFNREWGEDGMLGKWAMDERFKSNPSSRKPFEIEGMGMGLFACRKLAWRGFNPAFQGFGGEEIQYHDKVRAAGGKCLCLPGLQWLHKFSRVDGVPYSLRLEDRFRNYLIGHMELGKDVSEVLRQFAGRIPELSYGKIVAEVARLFSGKKAGV